ncbi:MAG: ABC transporter permease [Candidatus Marinimicrobia bacterium]|nr:ABC transporter permease [Candidatus Neomarinimicrobiota bacterium]
MRSILTTGGIIIGVLTVVSVASIVAGLNEGFANQISDIGSSTLYIQKYPWMAHDDWFEYRNRPNIKMASVDFLKEHVQTPSYIMPSTGTGRNVKYKDNELEDIRVSSATEETPEVEALDIELGRFFTGNEISHRKNSVVIGWDLKEHLFPNEDPLGKKIRVGESHFNVIGVLKKRGKIFGQSQDNIVYIPIGALFKNFGYHRSLTIIIKVKDPMDLEKAKEEIGFLMRVSRGLRPIEKDDFSINQQSVIVDAYKKLTGGLYTAAIGIGALSLLVGGIGIMNIMLVSVTERRREIGIRKALGATRALISLQFIVESVVICSVGGIIAIGLSFLMAFAIDKATPFPATVPVWSIFMGLGFSSFVGLFFGIYPARQAAKLNPIDCLHYE